MVEQFGNLIWSAAGSVEVVLILGKGVQCSVTDFGGKQDAICCYGSAGISNPEAYAEEAAAVCELGFQAMVSPALGPVEDLRTVALMREAVGSQVGLCLDAHAWWRMGDKSYSSAIVDFLAEAISIHGITWLEEPLRVEDRDAYARLKAMQYVAIAGGEHELDLSVFKPL